MLDPRNDKLAGILVDYSCGVKKGDLVYVAIRGVSSLELAKAVIRRITDVGGVPFWYYNDDSITRQFLQRNTEEQIKKFASFHLAMARRTDCYISINGSDNPFDLNDIPPEKMQAYKKLYYKPVLADQITKKTRWVVLRFPNNAMAQLAQKPQEAFEKFYYDVCCIDYGKMSRAMNPLVRLLKKTDKVHIKGRGTDLTFSIKNIPVVKCDGRFNIPDGEIFTAPVRNSLNGVITYNTPSLYEGELYENIRFEFKGGKIVRATCSGSDEKLNKILNTDPGARYVGEFALGVNPMIREPMKDTLFDEKIDGSLHLTPGRCYEESPNGNKSAIHWDLVLVQRKDYGGGEIWFDNRLVRKDGRFVIPQLKGKFTRKALGG
ncbi:MAG: aminopeptidase [Candidatus Zixiibacteriota bacterium]|nr:MAG: aminopeptidase [candidate division Zixibacteria bacterium]